MKDTRILTTLQFLEMLQEHYKYLSDDGKTPASDYRVAKELGVTQQTVSRWRVGKSGMDDETAVKVAEILGMVSGHVLACVHLERSKSSKVRAAWTVVAGGAANLAALAAIGFHAWPGV